MRKIARVFSQKDAKRLDFEFDPRRSAYRRVRIASEPPSENPALQFSLAASAPSIASSWSSLSDS